MNNWSEQTCKQLHKQLKGIKDSDVRFFRLEEFERMIKRTNDFAETCTYCRDLKSEITEIIPEIGEAIQTPGKLRRKYDKLINQIAKHQRRGHGYFPPYFYSYHYSFYGMIAGAILGVSMGWIIMPEELLYFVLIGVALGIIIAQIWGGLKDWKIRTSGKLL